MSVFISNKIIFVISVLIGIVATLGVVVSQIIIILIIYYLTKRWQQTSRRFSRKYGETVQDEEKLENSFSFKTIRSYAERDQPTLLY
jgi:hypothetical protein